MFNYRVLLLGAASALGLTTAVQAQTTQAAVDEVVVTGRRPLAESAAAALQVQRASDSLVSVLSADAVGNLPDQNIAFAVGRLPGIAIERDQGQARYVNLRGAPNYWTTLSFDGLSVVSPEGRASRFDNIPSAIASQIMVQKAIVPSMPGDTVAGNVDIRTRRAFDYAGQQITGKFGFGRVTLGDGDEIDSNLVYSNIFMDGRLGLVAQGSYYKREMATDNWETDPWLTNTTDPTKRFAREHENKHYRLIRENISASLRGDFRIDDNNTVFASSIYTLFHDDELRDNFLIRLDQGTNAAGSGYTSAGFITANDPSFGTSFGARLDARIDYRDTEEFMSTSTLGGEHSVAGFDVSWRLNHTYTQDGRNTPVTAAFSSPSTFNLRPTIEYDFRNDDEHTVRFFRTDGVTAARVRGAQVRNIEDFAFPMTSMGKVEGGDITMANTAKIDIDRASELFGLSTKFEFGGLYTDRTKKSRETLWSRAYASGTGPAWSTFATDIGYLGGQNLNYSFRYTDDGFTSQYMNDLIAAGTATRQDTRGNYWKVTEQIAAAYGMATTTFDWGNLVYGLRIEQFKNTGEAFVNFPAAGGAAAQTRLVQTSSDDILYYPSLHLNWNAREDIKVRVGLTTSASRPDFDDLRPNFSINDTAQTISGGNPLAKPEKQFGIDSYVEWYMSPTNFFSAGVFYKDIRDALVTETNTFGLDTLDVPGLDRSGYAFTRLSNAGDGHLKGAELFFSGTIESFARASNWPAWTEGFGVNLSATWTASEILLPGTGTLPDRTIDLTGTSDGVYNLQATYEKYGLSVRLAYQYRTPWRQSIGNYRLINGAVYPDGNGDIFWAADEEIDLSVRYQVNDNFEVFFDGVNLGDQPAERYGHTAENPIEHEVFGPRYIAGVRFNF